MTKSFSSLLFFLAIWVSAQFQSNDAAQIYSDLLRLQKNATVMYIAAHPDDENTRLISWLTHEKNVNAVYLSLTRGDGGQNLIGTEKGETLGLLRTQELLEARKVDLGKQWFTRAVDFGFSKTATETFSIWNKQEVLADVVWGIRKNRPEIIITRFSPDSNGETHGHHTASAILAMEAFDLAADKNAFPEQLKYVDVWQPKRLFFNTSWWFYGSQENFDKADKTNFITLDVGTYFPLLGKSNNEISAESRSKHACQGFGMALERGSQKEYLQLLKGNLPKNGDLLNGISLNWKNELFQKQVDKTITDFKFTNPQESLRNLLELYQIAMSNNFNAEEINRIKNLIIRTQGIYMEWTTPSEFGTNGQSVDTNLEVTNRSAAHIRFTISETDAQELASNESYQKKSTFLINQNEYSNPYWLEKHQKNDLYTVQEQVNRGAAELLNAITKKINIHFGNVSIPYEIPLQQKTVNPAIGELYEPFYVIPPFVIHFSQENFVFANQSKSIGVEIQNYIPNSKTKVSLITDGNWKISGAQEVEFKNIGEKKILRFNVEPTSPNANSELIAKVEYDGKTYSKSLSIIDYEHIKRQVWLREARVKIQNLDLKIPNVKVAYLQGSGDEIPSALREIGLNVDELSLENWDPSVLNKYQVIMIGIRAYNVQPQMKFINKDLWKFIENGGLVINQYQTNRGLVTSEIAPYELTLGRDRIAEENADLKILNTKHPVFNSPNKISKNDFEHWVQERGLYLGEKWDPAFEPLLEGHDTNENPKKGILLVADYGKGKYVYTGISFFRELPAGVPGAYKLLMNILNLTSND